MVKVMESSPLCYTGFKAPTFNAFTLNYPK